MTPKQRAAAIALEKCSFLPGSYEKRFARDMAARAREENPKPLSDRQFQFLEKMLHRYRRQLGGLQHYRAVHGEKLLEQVTAIFSPQPEPGSVVLGGRQQEPQEGDVVLGGDRRDG